MTIVQESAIAPTAILWFRETLISWGKEHLRVFPWRENPKPYHLFVAESLLQKTDAATVTPIYQTFLQRYPTVETLANAPLEEVAILLQPLGLFFRADRLIQAARILIEDYQGDIPDSLRELQKLPGIGIYSARAIASVAFDRPVAVLDANIARIIERFFSVKGGRVKSRCKRLWGSAEAIAPSQEVGKWNWTLIDFGAKVCTARQPKCHQCPLRSRCGFVQGTEASQS